ncbi:hypothetical protein U3516DRAFT_735600 [Neocallimastix sp. 'constans']
MRFISCTYSSNSASSLKYVSINHEKSLLNTKVKYIGFISVIVIFITLKNIFKF